MPGVKPYIDIWESGVGIASGKNNFPAWHRPQEPPQQRIGAPAAEEGAACAAATAAAAPGRELLLRAWTEMRRRQPRAAEELGAQT